MNTKFIRGIIASVLALGMLPVIPTMAEELPSLSVNESFNDCVTNTIPDSMTISARNAFVTEYATKEKGLKMYADVMGSSAEIAVAESQDTVLSFDIKAVDSTFDGSVDFVDATGKKQQMLTIKSNSLGAYNGFPLGGISKSKPTNLCVVYRGGEGTVDVYVNGKQKINAGKIPTVNVRSVTNISFNFNSKDGNASFILDNINVYAAKSNVIKTFPVAEYDPDAEPEIELTLGKQIGSQVLANFDMESPLAPFRAPFGNIMETVEDYADPTNHVYHVKRVNSSGGHINAQGLSFTASDVVVYETDIRMRHKATTLVIELQDSLKKSDNGGSFGHNAKGPAYYHDTGKIEFKCGEWHKVSFIVDYYDRKITTYFDGKKLGTRDFKDDFCRNGAKIEIFRFSLSQYAASEIKWAADDPSEYDVDNYRVYEGDKLVEDLGTVEKVIDLASTKKSVLPSDKAYGKMLSGYMSVHVNSGVVLKDGIKNVLRNKPYQADGIDYVPAVELAEKLGFSATIEGTNAKVNNVALTGVMNGDVMYVNLTDFIRAIGKIATKIPATYNSNGWVLGSTSFTIPEDQETIDELNHYMLFLRPTEEQIDKLYNESPLKGVHPRIHLTQDRVNEIKEQVKTDPYMQKWAQSIIVNADGLLKKDLLVYNMHIQNAYPQAQRAFAKNIHCLAMAWLLTDDKKYFDRGWAELENICSWVDWHPNEHLDTGEMMAAVAVAYDWFYNGMTPEQRKFVEEAMYKNGFHPSWLAAQSINTPMTIVYTANSNHCAVTCGGIITAALAFYDSMPKEAAFLLKNAIRGIDLNLRNWAPDGTWFEGAGYWELNTQFTTKLLDTICMVLNDSLGLTGLQGMSNIAPFEMALQTPSGVFNYYDAMPQNVYVPELFWYDNYYNNGISSTLLALSNGDMADLEDYALALVWYDPEKAQSAKEMPIDFFAQNDGVSMWRDSWSSKEPYCVGIKAGYSNPPHGQLGGGNFIFEADGVRWAIDLGMGNYSSEQYFDSKPGGFRWQQFRCRAESHNVVVLNPTEKEDMVVESTAYMTQLQSKPRGAIMLVDNHELYGPENVSDSQRGFIFTDNRRSLVVRDQFKLAKESDVYWFMMTDAEVTIEGNKATLYKDGRSCTLEILSNVPGELSVGKAEPLPSSPQRKDNAVEAANAKRIMFKLKASGELNITAKLTPGSVLFPSAITDYDKPVTEWNVPDGVIPENPKIDSITVGDKVLPTNGKTSVEFACVEGSYQTPPMVSVTSDIYDIEIEQSTNFSEPATIIVSDRQDPFCKSVYSVVFSQIKKPIDYPGRKSIPVMNYEVSDIREPQNPPIHLFDNNTATRWVTSGDGQWSLLDLGSVQTIDSLGIAIYEGNARKQNLKVLVSADGNVYSPVFDGHTSGTTTDVEFIDFAAVDARYVKIEYSGNSESAFNSITEIVIAKKY